MATEPQSSHRSNNAGLWITVIVEALVIIAVGAYNVFEIRRNCALVQSKIEKLSQFSARQGEKVDRMVTGIELYLSRKLNPAEVASTNSTPSEARIDKAIEFLQTLKQKEKPQ